MELYDSILIYMYSHLLMEFFKLRLTSVTYKVTVSLVVMLRT